MLIISLGINCFFPAKAQTTTLETEKQTGIIINKRQNRWVFHNGTYCAMQCFDTSETSCTYVVNWKHQC